MTKQYATELLGKRIEWEMETLERILDSATKEMTSLTLALNEETDTWKKAYRLKMGFSIDIKSIERQMDIIRELHSQKEFIEQITELK